MRLRSINQCRALNNYLYFSFSCRTVRGVRKKYVNRNTKANLSLNYRQRKLQSHTHSKSWKKQIRVFFSSSECFDPSRELMNLDSIKMWKGCLSTKKKFTFRWKFAKKKRARNFLTLQKLIRLMQCRSNSRSKKFHSRKIKSNFFVNKISPNEFWIKFPKK